MSIKRFSQEDCSVRRSKKHCCSFLSRLKPQGSGMRLLRMKRFKLLEERCEAVPRPTEPSRSLPAFEGARGCVLLRPETVRGKKSLTTISLIQLIGAVFDPVTGWDTQAIHGTQELPRTGCETTRE